MRRSTILRVAVTGSLALCAMAQSAVAAGYHKPDLRIIPAMTGVMLTAPRDKAVFSVGTEFKLTLANPLPVNAVDDLTANSFEIRLFRTKDDTSDPVPWYPNQDDCDVYLTLVFKGLRFTGDDIPITTFTDDWLVSSWFHKAPGYFLMVIEQETADDPDRQMPPNDMWEVFRLKRNSSKDYFRLGRHIEVDPVPSGGGAASASSDKEQEMKALLDAAASEISAHFNCYQPKPITVTATKATGLLIAGCKPVDSSG